ncbi:MAG: SulP family inorganic anion transporter [Oceanococcus sp.]
MRKSTLLPLLEHLRASRRSDWIDDILAGGITAVLLIPQGMAYALLAGLPAQMGLYASIIPPLVYAFLGSSRVLAVGPVAVAALMVATALSGYASGDPELYLTGALVLALEIGLILLLLGLAGMGSMVGFISHPVLSGFTSGAALLIILSQLEHLSGLTLASVGDAPIWGQLLQGDWHIEPLTIAIGISAVLVLLLANQPLRLLLRRMGVSERSAALVSRCMPLLVVVGGVVLVTQLGVSERAGLAVVGAIPAGLPLPGWGFLSAPGWLELFPSALLIALVGYVESISVAKALAARRRQRLDANQELIALGAANTAAAIFGGMPVAGGFSRSVVNFEAGARTQFAAIVSAALVAMVALFLSGWFAYLPKAVLAGIIVVAVAKLVDLPAAWRVWSYDKADGAALLVTLICVLGAGLEFGLLTGIALSLGLYLWRTSRPHMAVIGRVPGTEHYRNISRHSVETHGHTLLLRIDENLYFANVDAVDAYAMEHVAEARDAHYLVLVLSAVSYIDSSALEMLESLEQNLLAAGVELHLAEVKGPVMDRLNSSALMRALGKHRVHLTTFAAEQQLQARPQTTE